MPGLLPPGLFAPPIRFRAGRGGLSWKFSTKKTKQNLPLAHIKPMCLFIINELKVTEIFQILHECVQKTLINKKNKRTLNSLRPVLLGTLIMVGFFTAVGLLLKLPLPSMLYWGLTGALSEKYSHVVTVLCITLHKKSQTTTIPK